LKLEPPSRKVSPIALQAWREGRGKEPPPKGRGPRLDRRKVGVVAASIVGVLAALSLLSMLLAPGCIRQSAIRKAAEHGITMTVESARVGAGSFVLVGVTLKSAEMPALTMRAAEVEVEMAKLEPARVMARNGEITASGSVGSILASIASWHAAHALHATAGTAPPGTWGFESMRLAWTDPVGGAQRADALELRMEATPRAGELHVQSPHLIVQTARGTLGPWRFNYDHEAKSTRVRVGFDPQLGDGPSVVVISDEARVTQVELNVARSPLSALGMPAAVLGLSGATDATPVEATARYAWKSPGRAEARATLVIVGLRVTRATPLDAKVELEGAGDPAAGIPIKHGEIALGPLKGQVTGSLRAEGGARLDVAFTTNTIPCSAFLLAPPSSGGNANGAKLVEIGEQIKQLAHALGLAKVTGEYHADGSFVLDAADPSKSTASLRAQSTCEAELFGP
jgi:hypothetical protein